MLTMAHFLASQHQYVPSAGTKLEQFFTWLLSWRRPKPKQD